MFAIGMVIIALAFGVGLKWGNPGLAFNWADRVALTGVVAGSTMCFISMIIAAWRLMP